ncbi:MAG: TolC family protein [Hyphomicrobiales bacterium]
MRRSIYIILFLFGIYQSVSAQSKLSEVLELAEKNSLALQALINNNKAEVQEAKSDIWPDALDVSVGYSSNKDNSSSDKTIYGVSQTFDFPTLWASKIKLKNSLQRYAEHSENAFKQELLFQARSLFFEIVYYNKLIKRQEERVKNNKNLVSFYKTKLEKGDGNILDVKKTIFEQEDHHSDVRLNKAAKISVLEQLRWICQSDSLVVNDTIYEDLQLEPFEKMLQDYESLSPKIQSLNSYQSVVSQKAKLIRQKLVPSISIGYESEKATQESVGTFSVGLSIPIWGGYSKIKQSRAMLKASEYELANSKGILKNDFKRNYQECKALYENFTSIKSAVDNYEAIRLLNIALKSGNISIIEYYQEIDAYFEMLYKFYKLEKEYFQSLANLKKYLF